MRKRSTSFHRRNITNIFFWPNLLMIKLATVMFSGLQLRYTYLTGEMRQKHGTQNEPRILWIYERTRNIRNGLRWPVRMFGLHADEWPNSFEDSTLLWKDTAILNLHLENMNKIESEKYSSPMSDAGSDLKSFQSVDGHRSYRLLSGRALAQTVV